MELVQGIGLIALAAQLGIDFYRQFVLSCYGSVTVTRRAYVRDRAGVQHWGQGWDGNMQQSVTSLFPCYIICNNYNGTVRRMIYSK